VNSARSQKSTPYDAEKLLISTVDISKSSMCSTSDISAHLLRVISQLWKVIVSGTGEPDLEWANPASIIPLRIHAFATLLQLLGSTTIFLSKRGMTQLDGSTKWNLISLSRVVAMLFDEGSLFGSQAEEPFCKEFFAASEKTSPKQAKPAKTQKTPQERRRKHVRSNFEFFNNGSMGLSDGSDSLIGVDIADVLFGDLSGTNKLNTIDSGSTLLSTASGVKPGDGEKPKEADRSPLSTGERHDQSKPSADSIKMDSMTDFRCALEAGTRGADNADPLYEGSTSSGSKAAMAMIKAFSGVSATGSRRWMTAPAPGLPTIREDSGVDDSVHTNIDTLESHKLVGPLDSLDSEIIRPPPKTAIKQMRVPKLRKNIPPSNDNNGSSTAKKEDDGDSMGAFPQDSGSEIGNTGTGFPDAGQGLSLMYVPSTTLCLRDVFNLTINHLLLSQTTVPSMPMGRPLKKRRRAAQSTGRLGAKLFPLRMPKSNPPELLFSMQLERALV
jgi:hypothetical protein